MKHTIETTATGVRISASVSPDQQQALMAELGKCAAGTCSCPTPQYEKVTAIEVQPQATGVAVELQVKPGETIAVADIEACLAHTAKLIGA